MRQNIIALFLLTLIGCSGSISINPIPYHDVEYKGELVYKQLHRNMLDPNTYEIGIKLADSGEKKLFKAKQRRKNWDECMRVHRLYKIGDKLTLVWSEEKPKEVAQ